MMLLFICTAVCHLPPPGKALVSAAASLPRVRGLDLCKRYKAPSGRELSSECETEGECGIIKLAQINIVSFLCLLSFEKESRGKYYHFFLKNICQKIDNDD